MSGPNLSLILPVWNGARVLPRVLQAIGQQLEPADQVIVVDDGSSDGTPEAFRQASAAFTRQCQLVRQDRQGPAAARNAGLAVSTAAVVLFLGADVVPVPRALARHRAVHQRFPEETVGCLGLVTWDPLLPPTPFMVWLEHGGAQNEYGIAAGQTWLDPAAFCYGGNLSVKRVLMERVGSFDATRFRGYGWEDRELGLRLAARGVRLFFEPSARGYHVHAHSLDTWLRRQREVGERLSGLVHVHPSRVSLPVAATGWRYVLRLLFHQSPLGTLLRLLARWTAPRWILPSLYAKVSGWEFTRSVHRTLRFLDHYVEKFPK